MLDNFDKHFVEQYAKKHELSEKHVKEFLNEFRTAFREYVTDELTSNIAPASSIAPSKVLGLDLAIQGIPSGITQLYGWPDGFKTALLMHIANFTAELPVLINADNHPIRWKVKEHFLLVPNYRKANEVCKKILQTNLTDLIVVDSITSMDRSIDFIKSMIKTLKAYPELRILFSNQTRSSKHSDNVPWGPDWFHSVTTTRIGITKQERTAYGTKIHYKIDKTPFSEYAKKQFYIYYDSTGNVSNSLYLIDMAVSAGILTRVGPRFKLNDKNYTLGELSRQPELFKDIWNSMTLDFLPESIRNRPADYLDNKLENQI